MSDNSRREPQAVPMHQRTSHRGLFSQDIVDLVVPPLKVGGWAGTAGVLAGVGGSIFKEANPVVWGMVSGFQWFTLGTSFWFARSVAVRTWGGEDRLTPSDRTKASAIAGSVAGAMGGLIRGPSNILPAVLCWTAFGAGGQMIANRLAVRESTPKDESKSWMRSSWSPLRKLTDQEYIDMMSEKVLKYEAEIALIDDRIAELRAAEAKEKEQNP